jgi:hypothetical protein
MKLDPPSRQKVRVHELAAELGWTSRQLLVELSRRNELVKSVASTLEAPVVRAIRREFAPAAAKPGPDNAYAPELYGRSVDAAATDESDESNFVLPLGKSSELGMGLAVQTIDLAYVERPLDSAMPQRSGQRPSAGR